ncbi:hypothetical protein ACQP2C_10525 [Micromonospora zamorensis]|uniref:hypothetical protein n=1 Tax=Micromonospora zamorensis TaxID=709883 RepID=UPI003D99BB3D
MIAAVALYLLIQRISAAQEARIARAVPAWPNGPVWPNAPIWPAGSVPAGFASGTVPPASVPAASVPPASEHQSRPVSPQRTPEAGGTIGA